MGTLVAESKRGAVCKAMEKDCLHENYSGIYIKHQAKVYAQVCSITKDVFASEDIVQDVFLRLWSKRDELKMVDNVQAYLLVLARNMAIDYVRKRKKDRMFLKEYGEVKGCRTQVGHSKLQGTCHRPVPKYEEKEIEEVMYEATKRLTDKQRLVYQLRREHGWKRDKIAKRLNISENTVKATMQNVLKHVREYVRRSLAA